MRKTTLLIIAIVGLLFGPAIKALTITNETLNYQVVFHWGVIWKHAGDITLTTTKTANGYNSRLTGKTRSWADKIYTVRDTLKCSMTSNFRPTKYEKLTHENSYYAHDIVAFTNSSNSTSAHCTRYRKNKPTANLNLSANGVAYDMLSVFFMLRNIDFDKMKTVQGAKFDLSDFKGKWVYVQLFNVSCEDCIREMMIVKELQKKYEDKIAFVSLSLDFNYGQFIQFKERFPQFDWTFVHFNGRYDWIDNMEVTTLPDNLLIAPDGTLAKRYAPDITTKLSQFLAQLFSDGEEDPDLPLNRNNRP